MRFEVPRKLASGQMSRLDASLFIESSPGVKKKLLRGKESAAAYNTNHITRRPLCRILTELPSQENRNRRPHPALRWMAATLDGRVADGGAVFEAKFMLPWSFSEEAAAEKYMPQLQHNMWKRGSLGDNRGRQMGGDQGPR